MTELLVFLLALFGVVAILCLIWYWAMKKNKATLFLLISLFAFVNIGLGVFFWLSSDIGNIIIVISIGTTISQSLFFFILSKIAPEIFEKFGIKRKN